MTTMTIGELAKRVGLRTSALRYYEDQGLLTPVDRTEAGYRLYDPNAEQTLRFIQRAQRLGFSLDDIHSLLRGWQEGDLTDEAIIKTAKERYFALERQATQLLVLQHELGLFLQDMRQNAAEQTDSPAASLFHRLVDQVCANPLNQPAETVFDWLMTSTGCILTSAEGQALLKRLKGQHVHIWQEANDYHILVVSDNPEVGTAVRALAQLEANCQAHTYLQPSPEFISDGEGYLLIARGKNAFIFARLFLALEQENR